MKLLIVLVALFSFAFARPQILFPGKTKKTFKEVKSKINSYDFQQE